MGSRKNIANEQSKIVVKEVLDMLESLGECDKDDFVVKKDEIIRVLDKKLEEYECKKNERKKINGSKRYLNVFWEVGYNVFSDEKITLRHPLNDDKDNFLMVQKENTLVPFMFEEDSFCESLREEHLAPTAIMCSIVSTETNEYIGYCGIKDTSKERWEIAVEILEKWQEQGIGTRSISRLLDAVVQRCNVDEFRVRVDTDNYASQNLFEKLGAVPNGIGEFLLHDEESIKECEEDNLSHIDDKLEAVAKKFGVEARVLLSHVLEYRLKWKTLLQ